ncbi:MAG: glycerophosphodiester phosphodiesterase family protein [Granulosicoccus sp.]
MSYPCNRPISPPKRMSHAPLARIIAHRGASADAPENTLSALQLAADQGATCVEIDVSISADGIAFVHHDAQLQRCTNGTGLLCEHSAAQLDQLRAGKNMAGFENEPLPRLSAVITLLIRNELGLNLEIKPQQGLEQQTVNAIRDELQTRWPDHLALVLSSFSHKSIGMARECMPDVARAPLVGAIPDDWTSLMKRYDAQNLHCAENTLTAEKARLVTDAGFGLYCYTVNDHQRASTLLGWGVHGIFTDYPGNINV